jgi:hypothetical protein
LYIVWWWEKEDEDEEVKWRNSSTILELSTTWRCVVSFTPPATLHPGVKSP